MVVNENIYSMLSGGADSSIKLWNLEDDPTHPSNHTYKPTASITRGAGVHRFGITHLSFYPFDAEAFLSSSYDHSLNIYATETFSKSASFDLQSIIYTHAVSSIASHLLVACATQHPAVRLVDLRSGATTHALAGHHGALLSVAWSPVAEHVLASGGIDGTVRLWDIRKSAATLGVLDMEDSIGMRGHSSSRAHSGAVNGITWTDDGSFIVTAGQDERMRVWDAATGANTLANFGPTLKNSHLSTKSLLTTPTSFMSPGGDLVYYPNERDLLIFGLHDGQLHTRLKVPGPSYAAVRSRTGERNIQNRITALALRGQYAEIYSAHSDGLVRRWAPADTSGEDEDDKEPQQQEDQGSKRKRQVLDTVFRDLTRQKITFG